MTKTKTYVQRFIRIVGGLNKWEIKQWRDDFGNVRRGKVDLYIDGKLMLKELPEHEAQAVFEAHEKATGELILGAVDMVRGVASVSAHKGCFTSSPDVARRGALAEVEEALNPR